MEKVSGSSILALPEECIAKVVSRTSPSDACRLAVVSKAVKSAADSDLTWEQFLPSDYQEIISHSTSPVLFSSKKDLYFRMCDTPVLLDGGLMSFALDKRSGKKCLFLGGRNLQVIWGDTPTYWRWESIPYSRFPEVAKLLLVFWLEIKGRIDTKVLTPKTTYGAYFVYKIDCDSYGFKDTPVEVSVKFGSEAEDGKPNTVYLESQEGIVLRGDGWMEIEIGSFFNDTGDDGEVEMYVKEVKILFAKSGLIVEGFELRPKDLGV